MRVMLLLDDVLQMFIVKNLNFICVFFRESQHTTVTALLLF